MERKKRLTKRIASVRIEPYLAEYIQKKLEIEPETGGVKIPYTTDLYYVVWNLMAKPDANSVGQEDCNPPLLYGWPSRQGSCLLQLSVAAGSQKDRGAHPSALQLRVPPHHAGERGTWKAEAQPGCRGRVHQNVPSEVDIIGCASEELLSLPTAALP